MQIESPSPFETELGLPDGFLQRLRNSDDDWSFIIKVHALMEASVSYLLVHHFGMNGFHESLISWNER